ncbi:hypothetical protein Q4S45_09385 [Massilia sp. R2A-15]|uniref:hypothetical protein n=1 Tax=Massilia sp. R2A-15 TaxID=3064278 RepID=UPI00273657A5|nr:hypothetical protein [Massilia sp. R2A-15]WLI91309.1 hypothetical protein Q4S45_09385 [Massilia sp. R2A-15]
MAMTIPYDPSLILGNLVNDAVLKNVMDMATIQAPVDAAEDNLNSLIALKRSIDMTIQELLDMHIDTTDLLKQSNDVNKQVQKAAIDYAQKKIAGLTALMPLKSQVHTSNDSYESPIDYNKSQLKKMPLSSDSLKMNVQYFSFEDNDQQSNTAALTIKSFVSDELDIFGDSFKDQASSAAQSQMNSQYSRHDIAGTLVISVTCTHKDAVMLAPFVLDVDKGIRVWNKIYPDDMIKTDSLANVMDIAAKANTKDEKALQLLSGATYGSCFIGMVHVLDTTNTTASETMYSVAASMQGQFEIGGWFADESGGFGVDSSFSDDAKNLLSAQNVTSHCTLVTMGSIPSIKSNEVKSAVQQFAKFDGEESMNKLAMLQNATASDKKTVDSSADAARTGQQMIAMETSKVQGLLAGLATVDTKANKMLDINSMMDALDDYIQKALAGNLGVPINYYLKPVTKSELAEMWMSKYYPSKYLSIAGDDTPVVNPATPTPQPQPVNN